MKLTKKVFWIPSEALTAKTLSPQLKVENFRQIAESQCVKRIEIRDSQVRFIRVKNFVKLACDVEKHYINAITTNEKSVKSTF